MRTNNYLLDIINNINNYPEFKKYYTKLSKEQKINLQSLINNLNLNRLYKSPVHGQFHSEKVLLFAYLLATNKKYNDTELTIIADAAMYHDIGRKNDTDDTLHGYASGHLFERMSIFNPFYKNKTNLHLIQAIMDAHSYRDGRNDEALENLYYMHELNETEISFKKFKEMAHLLMDADALDRKRFKDSSPASLKEKYLYYPESKKMIKLATEVNEAYHKLSNKDTIYLSELKEETGAVVHSIGFVFPRITSILKYGILSASEREKKKIDIHRNFAGGNSNRWISVVPTKLVNSKTSTVDGFLKNGIVAKTSNIKYYKTPYSNDNASIAEIKNLPFIKGVHSEERFVLDKIEPNNIEELYIASECANKDLTELQYIFPNLDISIYENIIRNVINRYKASRKDQQLLFKQLNNYKKVLSSYTGLNKQDRIDNYKIISTLLNEINIVINNTIGIIIKKYYLNKFILNSNNIITPVMVLENELIEAGINYYKNSSKDKISFRIDLSKKNERSHLL